MLVLDFHKFYEPFLTVASILLATLTFWVHYWANPRHISGSDSDHSKAFRTSLLSLWIYIAMIVTIFAIVIAVYSFSNSSCNICNWAVALMIVAFLMLLVSIGLEVLRVKLILCGTFKGQVRSNEPMFKFDCIKQKSLGLAIFFLGLLLIFHISLRCSGVLLLESYWNWIVLPFLLIAIILLLVILYCSNRCNKPPSSEQKIKEGDLLNVEIQSGDVTLKVKKIIDKEQT